MAGSSDALWQMLASGLFDRTPRPPQKWEAASPGSVRAPVERVGATLSEGFQKTAEGQGLDFMFAPRVARGLFGVMAAPATVAQDEIMKRLPEPSQFTWNPTQPYQHGAGAAGLSDLLNLLARRPR